MRLGVSSPESRLLLAVLLLGTTTLGSGKIRPTVRHIWGGKLSKIEINQFLFNVFDGDSE